MKIRTIDWINGKIRLIDQTRLPCALEYVDIRGLKQLRQAIKELKVRGAPALAAASSLGVYVGVRDSVAGNFTQFRKELDKVIAYIASARPTARNLFWGLERAKRAALANKDKPIKEIKQVILREAKRIIEEDKASCRRIGLYGARLLRDKERILTICNAGILATIDYGTALAVIYRAKEEGKDVAVFSCETRPLLQGARLTTWELNKKNVGVTLICDNAAAFLMQSGKIDKVIAGADRIAANGDAANKIGTYNLAILCQYHKIPFYVAAPFSTFDLKLKTGRQIKIEQRPGEEVSRLFLFGRIAPCGVKIFNPAFDVTPHKLISAIITDRGIIRKPFRKNIRKILGRVSKTGSER